MFGECASVRPQLGAFVDDELIGVDMLRVRDHLDECASCRAEIETVRELGAQLRAAVGPETPDMPGLASGVISRVRAERAQSWRGTISRAVEDWHWAIVGLGSMAGTTVSTLIIASVLWFGPAPERGDSLSAMLSDLSVKETTFVVRPASLTWEQMAWRVAGGGNAAPGAFAGAPVMFVFPGASEADLVGALADALPRGRLMRLDSMPEADRLYTELLLDHLNKIRTNPSRVLLMSSTTVTAKGL
jgi:anti-sigma factor RsiW